MTNPLTALECRGNNCVTNYHIIPRLFSTTIT